jgi:hypothetical protein
MSKIVVQSVYYEFTPCKGDIDMGIDSDYKYYTVGENSKEIGGKVSSIEISFNSITGKTEAEVYFDNNKIVCLNDIYKVVSIKQS